MLAYLGDRLGLWRDAGVPPRQHQCRARPRCGYTERYVREWLAAQAAAGYVSYDPVTQSFTLPTEHALVLADEDGPAFMASGFEVLASVWETVDELANGYASGDGLGWHEHDSRLFVGFERFFRPAFRNLLTPAWLPERARTRRAAAVGHPRPRRRLRPGHGHHRDGRGLPCVDVRGHRLPRGVGAPCSQRCRRMPESLDRVDFQVRDAESYDGTYDLICMFDTLHDLGDPVGALAFAKAHLAEGGWFFAVEPNAGDRSRTTSIRSA